MKQVILKVQGSGTRSALARVYAGIRGFSPEVTTTEILGGHLVSIKDEDGVKSFPVMDGIDGIDGVSPIITIIAQEGGHTVQFVDAEGTKSFFVPNGQDGYTPRKGIDYFDGADGENANVIITSEPITGGNRVTFTETHSSSTASIDVLNGQADSVAWENVSNKPQTIVNIDTELAQKADLSDLDGLASEDYVDEKISEIEIPTKTSDLTNDSDFITSSYHDSTKADVGHSHVITDVTGLQSALNSKLEASDIEGLATESYVDSEIARVEAEIPTVDVDKAYVDGQIADVVSQIPDVSGYATKVELSEAIAEVKEEIPTVPTNVSAFTNDSGYITDSSLSGYATEQYVDDAIDNIDLSSKADVTYVDRLYKEGQGEPTYGKLENISYDAYIVSSLIPNLGDGEGKFKPIDSSWTARWSSMSFRYNGVTYTDVAPSEDGMEDGLYIMTDSGYVSVYFIENGSLVIYLNVSEGQSAQGFDIIDFVHNGVRYSTAELPQATGLIASEIQRVESEIPSLSGYATEQYVQNWHDSTKADVEDIPSLQGYATESYVQSYHDSSKADASDLSDDDIVDASVSSDTLTLTKRDGSTVEFQGGGSSSSSTTATLTVAGWEADGGTYGGYVQSVSVTGVTTTSNVVVSPSYASLEASASSKVYCVAQYNGGLQFTCTELPTVALTFNVIIM